MSHTHRWAALVLAVTLAVPAVTGAQTPRPAPPAPPIPPAAPVAPPAPIPPLPPPAPRPPMPQGSLSNDSRRIDIVLSRYLGDKRIESLPFGLLSSAAVNSRSSIRLGVELPTGRVRTSTESGVARSEPVMVYVGTNIDCTLTQREEGVYSLSLNLTHTMLAPMPKEPAAPGPVTPQPIVAGPATRTVGLSNQLTLREGRPQLFSLGVDQITGETVRAEVTVTTVK